METIVKVLGASVLGILIVCGLSALVAFPVMWLVNGLFSRPLIFAVFGEVQIGYMTALGLNILLGLLFKPGRSSSS